MSRSMPYRFECTEKCLQAQNDALNSTFFILRQTGPTAFVIKEDDERIYKVFLGDQHQCTCLPFQRDRELCKHICWLLLKRFRIPRTNSMLWQRGLVEREINELLRELTLNDDNDKRNKSKKNEDEINVDTEVEQRSIGENDVCPICQEEFLIKKLPTTYCRHGCGNNVHVKCMKVWLDHQVSIGEKTIKCPLCREIFGIPEQLKEEFRTIGGEKASIHLGYSCHRCHACPIVDKCYKCTTCEDYFLCQTCFNLNIHSEHSFDYRERSFQRWKIATREHLTTVPNALHQMIVNRDVNENDYEVLLQLENAQNTTVMGIPEYVVKSMPSGRIHERSQLLQNGEQCRVCLRCYQIGERVRRLPCRHKFHIDCIDGWLLHSHPTCPIDGKVVWSVGMQNEQREVKRATFRNIPKTLAHRPSSSLITPNLSLTILPYRVQSAVLSDPNQRFRCFHQRTPMPFETNARSRPVSANVRQRQFRQQSLLSSPSLLAEDIQRMNIELNQSSSSVLHYRLSQRSRSNAK